MTDTACEDPSPGPSNRGDCVYQVKKRKWTNAEEVCLIQSVLEREESLFGEIRGSGAKRKTVVKREGWTEVCDLLNAQFSNQKRDQDEVRKKYFNLKQRAKEKIDLMNKERKKTGGGPPVPNLTPTEEAMVKTMEGRPIASGLDGGLDTDETNELVIIPETKNPKENKVSKLSSENIELQTNIKLDNERLKLENEKLRTEIRKLNLEQNKIKEKILLMQSQRILIKIRLQKDYDVDLEDIAS